MNEGNGASRYGAIGLAVAGAILVIALLVQNVWQGQAIAALETDVVALRTQIADGRRANAVAAVGALSSMPSTKAAHPKKGKRTGTARKRGDRVARDPLAEGATKAKAGKAGKRRTAEPGLEDEEGAATP